MIDVIKKFFKRPIERKYHTSIEYSKDPEKTSRRSDAILFPKKKIDQIKNGNFENVTSKDIEIVLNLMEENYYSQTNITVYHGGCLGCITQLIDDDICLSCMYYDHNDDPIDRRDRFTEKRNISMPWWHHGDRIMYLDYNSDEVINIIKLFKTELKKQRPEYFL